MRALHIDIETYCDLDITEVGMFKYIAHPSFEIILFSYRFSDELFTTTIDLLNGKCIPDYVIAAIIDDSIRKKAWNVFFEFEACKRLIRRLCKTAIKFVNWYCTMTKAAYNGYPLKLEAAAIALKLPLGKMAEGRALIKYFCTPSTPCKANDYSIRNYTVHNPDKWELFKKYNNQDVEVEVEIDHMLPIELPESEYEAFQLDYEINSYGIKVDLNFLNSVISLTNQQFNLLLNRSKSITGLDNPNSPAQLKEWLEEKLGTPFKSIGAEIIDKLIKNTGVDSEIKQVLQIRQELSLSSLKKYPVMRLMADIEGIIRGMHQYYGANRTGRYAGRGVQPQNMPKQGDYKHQEITFMRNCIKPYNSPESLAMMFTDVQGVLKLLLRTAFIPRLGFYFLVADWSAIEARILAWLSGCKWRMEVFATHGKIYEASVAKMMGVPIEAIKKPSKERDRGKVAELALGYQGWVPALIRMGALEMGIHPDELPNIAGTWRKENPEIAHKQYGLWARCEKAFRAAFEYPGKIIRFAENRLAVQFKHKALIFTLPSGRQLFYPNAFIGSDKSINYYGIDQVNKQWKKTSLYGGKITENAVQAIARDILVEGLKAVRKTEFKTVMHVHDEMVIEVPEHVEGDYAKKIVNAIMTKTPSWAEGLILKCDIFTSSYYRKN